jgi:diadenosine tetraphosphatase ApaH/serine/threonine PP2A family protein phosphatase
MFFSAEVIRAEQVMIALELAREAANASAAGLMHELDAATTAMQGQRASGTIAGGTVTGGLVELKDVGRLVIAGDIHGDARALSALLDEIQYRRFLPDPLNKLVFLGDYVDRGSDSAGVLYAVSKLKRTYPDSVVLMRGNHEAPVEFPFGSHDLPYHLMSRFGSDAKTVYGKALSFFQAMPLAVIIAETLLLVHGGLPTGQGVAEQFRGLVADAQENHMHNRVMEELLWNDPRPLEGEPGWEASSRGLGRHFGRAITERWLAATGTRVVVRGHEPCRGYRMDHGGTVLTLFSTTEVYPSFAAAYITIDRDGLASVSSAGALAKHAKMLEL